MHDTGWQYTMDGCYCPRGVAVLVENSWFFLFLCWPERSIKFIGGHTTFTRPLSAGYWKGRVSKKKIVFWSLSANQGAGDLKVIQA